MKRRDFLKNSAALAAVTSLPASITRAAATDTAYPCANRHWRTARSARRRSANCDSPPGWRLQRHSPAALWFQNHRR